MANNELSLSSLGIQLPYNMQAEQSVLGAALMDETILNRLITEMDPDMFYSEQNRAVYEEMRRLFSESEAVDVITLVDSLAQNGVFKGADDAKVYITRIAETVPAISNVDSYIKIYTGRDEVDMVVTLHACDTATDYALEKAVKWNAKVILSVPCCQHELNRQIANKELYPIMDYGILKERMAALLTDGIRAKLLENAGYETQILEFIDMEHTPKNLLIRAVKRQEGSKKLPEELKVCMEAYHVKPTLADLLTEKEEP